MQQEPGGWQKMVLMGSSRALIGPAWEKGQLSSSKRQSFCRSQDRQTPALVSRNHPEIQLGNISSLSKQSHQQFRANMPVGMLRGLGVKEKTGAARVNCLLLLLRQERRERGCFCSGKHFFLIFGWDSAPRKCLYPNWELIM